MPRLGGSIFRQAAWRALAPARGDQFSIIGTSKARRKSTATPTQGREKLGSARHGLTVPGRVAAVERAERAGFPRDIGDAPIIARAQQFEHHLLGLARIHERDGADRLERPGNYCLLYTSPSPRDS